MPRILDEPLVSSSVDPAANPTFTRVRALTSVSAGALVTLTEQGGARQAWRYLSDLQQAASEISPNQGVQAAMPLQRVHGSIAYNVSPITAGDAHMNGLHVHGRMAVLAGGSVVSVWAMVTGSTWQLTVLIDALQGRTVPAEVVVKANLSQRPYARVAALANGNFVVVWIENSVLRQRIYDPTGAAVTADTGLSIMTDARQTGSSWSLVSDATGYVVVSLSGLNIVGAPFNGEAALQAERFSNTGGTVGSPLNLPQGSATNGQTHALTLTRCANGDLVIAYAQRSAGPYSMYRVTANLTQVWGRVTINNNAWPLAEDSSREQNVWELANGRLVVATRLGGDIAIYSAAGSLIAAPASYGFAHDVIDVVAESSGNFVMFGFAAAMGLSAIRLDAWGNIITPMTTLMLMSHTQRLTSQIRAYSMGPAGFAVVSKPADTTTPPHGAVSTWRADVLAVTPNLNFTGALHNIRAGTNVPLELYSTLLPTGQLYIMQADNGALFRGVYHPARASILGVAPAGAAAGDVMTVQTSGVFDLPPEQRLNFSGMTIDGRNATPPGPRVRLIENQVALQGMI
jgi:hypothetical protein